MWYKACAEDHEMRRLAQGSQVVVFTGMSEMEEQVLTFGYTTLFVVAAPWVPLITLFSVVVEGALDKQKLLTLYRRPYPVNCNDNEPWDTAFDLIGIAAMLT